MDRPVSPLDEALDLLRRKQVAARTLGVELVGVVGSVARGDARPDSDVDVVYDVINQADLWGLGGLAMDIQDALGRRIDLVDRAMMKPERWDWMSRDLVRL